jgi:diguanylate cyclase (GGDEF)-like protein/PAS domain S-box-containing protein
MGFPENLAEFFDENLRKIIETKQPVDVEFSLQGRGGEYIMQTRAYPEFDEKGEVTSVVTVTRDITERKRIEKELVRSQGLYQDLVERQVVGVYRIRVHKYNSWESPDVPHYEYEFMNDEYCRLTGVSREDHLADPTLTLKMIHPEDYPSFAKKNEEVDITNKPFVWEGRMIIRGETCWVHYESCSRQLPDEGKIWTGILMDITDRKQAESKLRASEERFRQLILSAPDAVFLVEPSGKIAFANTEATNLLGYAHDEFIGMDVEKLIPQTLRESHIVNRTMYMDDPRTRLMGVQRDLHTVRKDGSEIPVDVKLSPVKMEANIFVVAFMRDITERKQAEKELHAAHKTLQAQFNEITKLKETLQEQAIRDPLTNLHNRRYLNEMLGHETARAKRENYSIGIMLIDIDRFKAFNDTYGHSAGDEVLKSLSRLLVESIRQGDIACRYGGEEFLVVMIGAREADVERRAESICRDFSRSQIRFGNQGLSTTVSIGTAFYPRHGAEIQSVIDAADAAMYQAKQAGRNRVQVWQAG